MKKMTVAGIWKTYPYRSFEIHPDRLPNRCAEISRDEIKPEYLFFRGAKNHWYDLGEEEIKIFESGDYELEFEHSDEQEGNKEIPNVKCDCGCMEFKVIFWQYPYCGNFTKIICSKCGADLILFDNFA